MNKLAHCICPTKPSIISTKKGTNQQNNKSYPNNTANADFALSFIFIMGLIVFKGKKKTQIAFKTKGFPS